MATKDECEVWAVEYRKENPNVKLAIITDNEENSYVIKLAGYGEFMKFKKVMDGNEYEADILAIQRFQVFPPTDYNVLNQMSPGLISSISLGIMRAHGFKSDLTGEASVNFLK